MEQKNYEPTEEEVSAVLGGYESKEIEEITEKNREAGWELDKIVSELEMDEKDIPPGIEYRVVGAGGKLLIFKRNIKDIKK